MYTLKQVHTTHSHKSPCTLTRMLVQASTHWVAASPGQKPRLSDAPPPGWCPECSGGPCGLCTRGLGRPERGRLRLHRSKSHTPTTGKAALPTGPPNSPCSPRLHQSAAQAGGNGAPKQLPSRSPAACAAASGIPSRVRPQRQPWEAAGSPPLTAQALRGRPQSRRTHGGRGTLPCTAPVRVPRDAGGNTSPAPNPWSALLHGVARAPVGLG